MPRRAKEKPGILREAIGDVYTTLCALDRAGASADFMERIGRDSDYARLVGKLYQNAGVDRVPDAEEPLFRKLGPGQYFGVREFSRIYWVLLNTKQLAAFPAFPWPVTLFDEPCPFWPDKRILETHTAYLGLDTAGGKSFDYRRICTGQHDGRPLLVRTAEDNWLGDKLEHEALTFRWYLCLKQPANFDLTLEEAKRSLPAEYEMGSAAETLMGFVAAYYISGRNRPSYIFVPEYPGNPVVWTGSIIRVEEGRTDVVCLGGERHCVKEYETESDRRGDRLGVMPLRRPGL